MKFDSIGLAGSAVGVIDFTEKAVKWAPRHESEASAKDVTMDTVLRASWAQIGKMCHVRLFCKAGEKLRFDGFRRADIDSLTPFFESKDIDFDREKIASGGCNYGTIDLDASAGTMAMKEGAKGIFELSLDTVAQCNLPGHKQDEIDIQFREVDSKSKEAQELYSMRIWIPGQQAAEVQSSILSQATVNSGGSGEVLIEFEREQGSFLSPKGRYGVEMYDTCFRLRGTQYDLRIDYKDVSRFYMLEKPTGRQAHDVSFFYFVVCLDKPVRQGQQKYPYLVWQTQNEDSELEIKMEEADIDEKYPGSGLKASNEGPLHRLIGKVFKVLSGKTVFAGSKKYRSVGGDQCISCNLGQRNGLLYPNDKSFVFLHQPTLVVEYSEVDYVEFIKEPGTRNFEFVIQKKGGDGKKLKFGAIEKKEFNGLAEFVKSKEAFFEVRDFEPEAEEMDDDEDEEDDEAVRVSSAPRSAFRSAFRSSWSTGATRRRARWWLEAARSSRASTESNTRGRAEASSRLSDRRSEETAARKAPSAPSASVSTTLPNASDASASDARDPPPPSTSASTSSTTNKALPVAGSAPVRTGLAARSVLSSMARPRRHSSERSWALDAASSAAVLRPPWTVVVVEPPKPVPLAHGSPDRANPTGAVCTFFCRFFSWPADAADAAELANFSRALLIGASTSDSILVRTSPAFESSSPSSSSSESSMRMVTAGSAGGGSGFPGGAREGVKGDEGELEGDIVTSISSSESIIVTSCMAVIRTHV
mmetsp:Transcript_37048/g.82982  ORF Transcript_37048/g.82982 Transcript_37048/m.82982 type:complete len:758 (+) Transcript_37048:268-2541(+)